MCILWKETISKDIDFEDVWGFKYVTLLEAVVQWALQVFVSKKPLPFCMFLRSVSLLGMVLYICALTLMLCHS